MVQLHPGPPAFAREASEGCRAEAHLGEGGRTGRELRLGKPSSPTSFAHPARGAVAQLGERELCKLEVVGSIPIGSTSLRSRDTREKAAAPKPLGEGGPGTPRASAFAKATADRTAWQASKHHEARSERMRDRSLTSVFGQTFIDIV